MTFNAAWMSGTDCAYGLTGKPQRLEPVERLVVPRQVQPPDLAEAVGEEA